MAKRFNCDWSGYSIVPWGIRSRGRIEAAAGSEHFEGESHSGSGESRIACGRWPVWFRRGYSRGDLIHSYARFD